MNKYQVIEEYTEWKLKGQFQKYQVPLFITFKKQVTPKKHLNLNTGNLGSLHPDLSDTVSQYKGVAYFLFSLVTQCSTKFSALKWLRPEEDKKLANWYMSELLRVVMQFPLKRRG